MIDLFLSNNRTAVFLEQKNKIQITVNQNIFQPTARNLFGISSVNIKFSNEFIP